MRRLSEGTVQVRRRRQWAVVVAFALVVAAVAASSAAAALAGGGGQVGLTAVGRGPLLGVVSVDTRTGVVRRGSTRAGSGGTPARSRGRRTGGKAGLRGRPANVPGAGVVLGGRRLGARRRAPTCCGAVPDVVAGWGAPGVLLVRSRRADVRGGCPKWSCPAGRNEGWGRAGLVAGRASPRVPRRPPPRAGVRARRAQWEGSTGWRPAAGSRSGRLTAGRWHGVTHAAC